LPAVIPDRRKAIANRSFVHAMHVTTVVSAMIAVTGAVLIAVEAWPGP